MNRTLKSGVVISLAMFGIFSCSGDSSTGTDSLNTNDLSADANLIASVTVSFGRSTIAVGDTTMAKATLRDWHNRLLLNRVVSWSSSDNAVATVSTGGLVTGVSAGTAVITAARAGKSGSATITVTSVGSSNTGSVASVAVSLVSAALNPGQTTQAAATVRDSASNVLAGRNVSWNSTDPAVATVSSIGLVTAVAIGTSQITATSEGISGSAAVSVTTPPTTATSPGSVQDLKAAGNDSTTVTLSFTQVDDGTGQPAKYDVRFAPPPISWGSATSVSSGTCTTPVAGTAIGSALVCKVLGLKPSTAYNFQVIAFRGTLNQNAVFGSLSNVVSATTGASATPPPPPPVPVASVTISPASVSLQVGGTSQLTATTRDASNNLLTGRTITWASGNGAIATVSAGGLVTAIAAGTVQITATSEGKGASATIVVSALSAPPPPPPGSVEPAGMTVITERPFSAVGEDSWTDGGIIQSDASAPQSPSGIETILFPAGFTGGDAPAQSWTNKSWNYRTMYLSVWMKISSNWQGHPTGANKVVHLWIGGSNHVVLNLWGSGSGMMQAGILLQGIVNNGSGGTSANWYPNLGSDGEIVRGRWHHVELVAVGNTAGAADGSVDWWLDGVKIGSHSGIQYVSGAGMWGGMNWSPTWGGSGSVVTSTMSMSFDHFRMSGK